MPVGPAVPTSAAAAIVVYVALRPVQCLWLPSLPPKGPFCSTFFGLPTSSTFAVLAAMAVGAMVAYRLSRRRPSARREEPR